MPNKPRTELYIQACKDRGQLKNYECALRKCLGFSSCTSAITHYKLHVSLLPLFILWYVLGFHGKFDNCLIQAFRVFLCFIKFRRTVISPVDKAGNTYTQYV